MKRLFLTLLALTLIPFYVSAQEYQYIDVGREKLKVENRKMIDNEGNEFVMKGMAVVNVFQGGSFNEERISTQTLTLLKEAGFNTIRFQLRGDLFYNFTTKEFNQTNIDVFTDYLRRAEEVGMYIIVDLHSLIDGNVHSAKTEGENQYCLVSTEGSPYEEDFFRLWEKLATISKDYKSVLAYELVNEPTACIKGSETQTQVRNYYNGLLQTAINRIRAIDPETIISFQPINSIRKSDDYYTYQTISVDPYPDVTGTNFLVDMKHIYPRPQKDSFQDIVYVSVATGAKSFVHYHADPTMPIDTNDFTISTEISCTRDCQIPWLAVQMKNTPSGTLQVNELRIYKMIQGEKVLALEANKNDDPEKLKMYNIKSMFNEITMSNNKDFVGPEFQNLNVGMHAGETIRIELDINVSEYESDSQYFLRYNMKEVTEANENGNTILTGNNKFEKIIQDLDSIAKRYGSPVYIGEYCMMAQMFNDYSNYKNYTDEFLRVASLYHVNWMWHRMSEWSVDNGYGAYVNGITPTVANRRSSMWDYVIPTMLSQPGEYAAEALKEENDNKEEAKEEIVMNPKTGVKNNLLLSLALIAAIAIVLYLITKVDKFKSKM